MGACLPLTPNVVIAPLGKVASTCHCRTLAMILLHRKYAPRLRLRVRHLHWSPAIRSVTLITDTRLQLVHWTLTTRRLRWMYSGPRARRMPNLSLALTSGMVRGLPAMDYITLCNSGRSSAQ